MDTGWIQNAQAAFIRLYGEKKGRNVCAAVLPGVMSDFRRMLAEAAPDAVVRETYRLDDGRAELALEGRRTPDDPVLTKLLIGGVPVAFANGELRL